MDLPEIVEEKYFTTTKKGGSFIYQIALASKVINGITQYALLRRWHYANQPPPPFNITEWSPTMKNDYNRKVAQKIKMNYKITDNQTS